jgi:hypothetical protein
MVEIQDGYQVFTCYSFYLINMIWSPWLLFENVFLIKIIEKQIGITCRFRKFMWYLVKLEKNKKVQKRHQINQTTDWNYDWSRSHIMHYFIYKVRCWPFSITVMERKLVPWLILNFGHIITLYYQKAGVMSCDQLITQRTLRH